jgi:hypothetical protein
VNHRDFWEAGHRVFGLHGVLPNGTCACGDSTCKAVLKHPLVSNWQHTPHWSEEQLEVMEMMDQFKTGFGILCRLDDDYDLLVVDVDARNGGLHDYQRLLERVPAVSGAGLIVNTGSGGGSKHLFFKVRKGLALLTKHPEYKGIDFKSGAHYVVGAGSLHASGNRYEVAYGSPEDIEEAPEALVQLLQKPERHRADLGNRTVDVSHNDLADMVRYVTGYDDYEVWVRVGMALHHASGGSALDVWDQWSQQSSKYVSDEMPRKWHSFGKGANPVTLGTLVHYAEQGGWKQPVTFQPDVEFDFPEVEETKAADKIDTKGVDLLRPPGLVGRMAEWIDSRGRKPRERLAAMAAIYALGNIAGLRYIDDRDRATTNLFVFNVAGSGSGKEAIVQSINEIMLHCGMSPATHGTIKSEQEITRNLTRHQAAMYVVDEIGFLLQKIKSAQKRGGAAYLEGVIGLLMSAYSKADGRLLISGDMKEDVRAALRKELVQVEKQMEEVGEKPYLKSRQEAIFHQLQTLDFGLDRPFLSMCGFTTGKNFDELVDYEAVANGFMGRAILNIEPDTAPETRIGWRKPEFPESLKVSLQQIAMGGQFDMTLHAGARVENYGERIVIPTEKDAAAMLDSIIRFFDRQAQDHKERTGLEALLMRGYEQVTKVSLILAIPEGVRTVEHVRWAFTLIKRDLETKMRLVTANDREVDAPALALRMRVEQMISGDEGETINTLVTRLRKFRKEDIQSCLNRMVESGDAETVESIHKYNKSKIVRYKLVERD